jgi:BNR repeat-like domain
MRRYMRITIVLIGGAVVALMANSRTVAEEADLYQKMPRDARLTVEVSQPFTISTTLRNKGRHEQPHLWRLADGTLLCDFHFDPDISFARRVGLRSVDNGKTWNPDPQRVWREESLAVLRDGKTVISIDTYAIADSQGRILGSQCRSNDGGKTFGPAEDLFIDMPLAVGGAAGPVPSWYSPAKRNGAVVGAFWRSVIERDDGDLLATMHTSFRGDKKIRTVVLHSTDKGHHWRYLATVAADEAVPTEGFTEPVMAKMPDGHLLCVMRTDGHQPLVMSRSEDDGKTWSAYKPTGVKGVDPDLAVLDNGIVACSFGRPNVYVMFSLDNGRHWSDVTLVHEYGGDRPVERIAIYGGSDRLGWSFAYTGLRQIDPNKLLLVWDQAGWRELATTPADTAPACTAIRGVTINVMKKPKTASAP